MISNTVFIVLVLFLVLLFAGLVLFVRHTYQEREGRLMLERDSERATLMEERDNVRGELMEARRRAEEREKEHEKLKQQLTERITEAVAREAALNEKLKGMTATREELAKQTFLVFKNAAGQLLDESRKTMTEESKTGIGALLEPLKQQIKSLNDDLDKYQERQNDNSARFDERLKKLTEANTRITEEAARLSNALVGNNKIQGDWGENVLQRVLDLSGLQEGVHYKSQATRDDDGKVLANDDGERLRPDFLLYMPDGKMLVVDSKVSLTAFVEYVNANDDNNREEALKRHIASVKAQVDLLASKDYAQHISKAADFVLMFMPSEPAYIAAMQGNKDLWQYAYSKRVVIVSPTHFLSVAQLLMQLWSHDRQSRNVEEIGKQVTAMMKKFDAFVGDLERVEKCVDDTKKAIGAAWTKFDGKGGLRSKSDKIKSLTGIKQLPEE